MGTCLSKKSATASSPTTFPIPPDPQSKPRIAPGPAEFDKPADETVKKEIFIIKHRRSHHEVDRGSENDVVEKREVRRSIDIAVADNGSPASSSLTRAGAICVPASAPIRTSSCTNEEVESILIQCGRLSRSSSAGKAAGISASGVDGGGLSSRKYSGSKRSYDFDNDATDKGYDVVDKEIDANGDGADAERIRHHRHRHRQGRSSSSPSVGRRRTPSRERDQSQQRSGSREGGTGGGGGGRRVSRSPGRRSESPVPTSGGAAASSSVSGGGGAPGKMVSVPATVTSLTMGPSNGGGGAAVAEPVSAAAIKRIQVKRNAGDPAAAASGPRSAASPRTRSPARVRAPGETQNVNNANNQQQQPLSLSRSNSKRADQSPYRRNPLSEIDNNALPPDQIPLPSNKSVINKISSQAQGQICNLENDSSNRFVAKDNAPVALHGGRKEQLKSTADEAEELIQSMANNSTTVLNVVASGMEGPSLKQQLPQSITRSRSLRRSKDLDFSPEGNPTQSYTALLLEDIQNFHQKNTALPAAISLPACVTKACSILEAVADLNSTTSSNLSSKNPAEQFSRREENKTAKDDLFLESEVFVGDDLTQPSCHKYVTVRRRGGGGAVDIEDEEESSGSNSFVAAGGCQQQWLSSSSWEPNSADSTDCRTSSRSNNHGNNGREDVISETGKERKEGPRRLGGKRRDSSALSDHHQQRQQSGIGRGRDVFNRVLQEPPSSS